MFHLSNNKNMPTQLLSLIVTMAIMVSWVILAKEPVASSHLSKRDLSIPAAQANTETGTANNPSEITASPTEPNPATEKRISEAYGKLPLSFEANQGQADSEVKFISRGGGYNLFLTSTEAVLALRKPATNKRRKNALAGNRNEEKKAGEKPAAILRMKLNGANPEPKVSGQGEMPGNTSYFIGNDPDKWSTDIPSYAKVKYEAVYPGVDMVYYGNRRQLEYDFVVAPGADPSAIKLAFKGARKMRVDTRGDLVLRTAGGDVRWQKPVIYQEIDGIRQEVPGGYVVKGRRQVGFHVGTYDPGRTLLLVYDERQKGREAHNRPLKRGEYKAICLRMRATRVVNVERRF